MRDGSEWLLCSVIEKLMLEKSIGEFLRTHRNGYDLLADWLRSVPADRTEDDFLRDVERRRQMHEEDLMAALADINGRRTACGLPPIDRHGHIVSRSQ